MATTIAISGKGGSGKTTIAAMIIRALTRQSAEPVLAVDADPNSCLGLTMGFEVSTTIAEVREKARSKEPNTEGMDRIRLFEYGLQQAVVEAKGFDLLTMGRPEGPDCYCAVNNLLRRFLDKISVQYSFVVIDNEAGMEHLSRRTTNNVDFLCIVAEPAPIGAATAKRIFDLAKQLPISVKKIGVIWNQTHNTSIEHQASSIESFGCVPYDKTVFDASSEGKTIFELDYNCPAFSAVREILETKLNVKKT
jgi:CO dehydrogenase maturation factor